jgi:hypothetical protein
VPSGKEVISSSPISWWLSFGVGYFHCAKATTLLVNISVGHHEELESLNRNPGFNSSPGFRVYDLQILDPRFVHVLSQYFSEKLDSHFL